MKVTCKSNNGFEDQLTTGKDYSVDFLGENGYRIVDDTGTPRWYGTMHFKVTNS